MLVSRIHGRRVSNSVVARITNVRIRNTAKNKIQELAGGRKDYKIDCIAAEFKDWEVSW